LDKKTSDVAGMYTGRREVYTGDDVYCVYMSDIDAVYYGEDQSNSLDEDFKVTGLYVLKNSIKLDGEELNEINDVKNSMGDVIYQGNTIMSDSDEIALNKACEVYGKNVLYGKATYTQETIFDDVYEVSNFERQYTVYIYVCEKDGIIYTFFCKDKDAGFGFYMMES
jgi:hypothetical protein